MEMKIEQARNWFILCSLWHNDECGFSTCVKNKACIIYGQWHGLKEPSLLYFCFKRNMKMLIYVFVHVFIWTKHRNTKKKWLHHINKMPCNRLLRILKYYRLRVRKIQGSPLKRLWNVWYQGQQMAQIHVSLMMMMMIYCLYQHFARRLHTAHENMRN